MTSQDTLNKFNDLISQASDAVLCNSDCQQKRKAEQLKQKYTDAQANLASAPAQVYTARQNVLCSLRKDRRRPLRRCRRPERLCSSVLQPVCRHLLQGQRRSFLRRLGSRSQPLGLLLQPLLNGLPSRVVLFETLK